MEGTEKQETRNAQLTSNEKGEIQNSKPPQPPKPEQTETFQFLNTAKQPLEDINYKELATKLLDYLFDKNPFYLISALLIIYAQSMIFRTDNIWMDTAIPAGIMAVYTLMMAGAAIVIVRAGKVWDDARSIIAIVMFLFMILSVSIDGIILNTPATGKLWLLCGFIFSVLLSEGLRHGLRIKLPGIFSLVYYGILALFFGYPWLLSSLVWTFEKNTIPVSRAIMLFPAIAALLYLTLIPAIRKGRKYIKNNGTPWQWPLFPWSLFGIFAIGIACRTYLMSISFIGGKGVGPYSKLETGFGLYMLVPLAFALTAMLYEHAATYRKSALKVISLCLPAAIFVMSLHNPETNAARQFLQATAGIKPYLATMLIAIAFYLYTWIRGSKISGIIVQILLGLVFIIEASQHSLAVIGIPEYTFAIALIIILMAESLCKRTSGYFFATTTAATLLAAYFFRNTVFMMRSGAIPAHIIFFYMFLTGAMFRDRFAMTLRRITSWLLPILCLAALIAFNNRQISLYTAVTYASIMTTTGLIGMVWIDRQKYVVPMSLCAIQLFGFANFRIYKALAKINVRGLGPIFFGLLFFATALLISLWKGGVFGQHRKQQNN